MVVERGGDDATCEDLEGKAGSWEDAPGRGPAAQRDRRRRSGLKPGNPGTEQGYGERRFPKPFPIIYLFIYLFKLILQERVSFPGPCIFPPLLLLGGPVFIQLPAKEQQTARERQTPKDKPFPYPSKIEKGRINKPGKGMQRSTSISVSEKSFTGALVLGSL